MDALHCTTRTTAISPVIGSASLLLACLVATPALAQQSAPAQGATATPTDEVHAGTAPAPGRKRSGFGAAMAQLTQALREASEQAATPPAKADATSAPMRTDAEAAGTGSTLAVESPP